MAFALDHINAGEVFIMDTLKHGMTGYRIPSYMEEILTHSYCPYFIKMSIIRDGDSYKFSYRPGRLTRLRTGELDTYEKLMLLRSLITINEAAESFLIGAENYLIEPELVYTDGEGVAPSNMKLLFYPDVKKLRFPRKLMLFSERIRNQNQKEEKELLGHIREVLEGGDLNRAKMLLDKNLIRIESREMRRAG
jgi:hypothetical protein